MTDSDGDTQQQGTDESGIPPDNCIDCDSQNVEPTPDESEQFICSDCELVMEFNEPKDSYSPAHWSEQTDTATVGIVTVPHQRRHEYYKIDNPRDFFENCSGEKEEKRRIKQSDLDPFETISPSTDLPPIDWTYTE